MKPIDVVSNTSPLIFLEKIDCLPLKLAQQLEFISFEDLKSKVTALINDHGLFISQNILNQYFESF